MPERLTKNRVKEFITCLENFGGSSGNKRLREELEWDEEFYWRVQGELVKIGRIVAGRGKGGSVRLTLAESGREAPELGPEAAGANANDFSTSPRRSLERQLYEPIKATIEATWIERFGFDDFRVEETHSRGSKQTGGTFTRPDITAVGIRRYVFVAKRVEIITFEIKPAESVGIMGVLEAIAHREAAHRSYVIFSTSRERFDSSVEVERVSELAQKYGIGLVLCENPKDVESWEILIDAIRHEPDPARLDRFLGDLPNEALKKQLHKWIA
jgi:hypothetical protein